MSFVSHIGRCLRYLVSSFSADYVPPCAASTCENLEAAISDCSVQGKILVLHLTRNGAKSDFDFTQFDEDSYYIYEAPYNSVNCFSITKYLDISSLPSVSLCFCRTKFPKDMIQIREIKSMNDLKIARRLVFTLRDELAKRKRSYINSKVSRVIIKDQDKEYNEVLKQAQEEEVQKRKKEEEERKENEKMENRKLEAIRRFNSLPPEPTGDNCIEIMFRICNKPTKSRKFMRTDKVELMFDFVDVDMLPSNSIIKYGYPIKTIMEEDKTRTFEEMGFGKRIAVHVDQDDEDC